MRGVVRWKCRGCGKFRGPEKCDECGHCVKCCTCAKVTGEPEVIDLMDALKKSLANRKATEQK